MIDTTSIERLVDMTHNNPKLVKELAQRRSMRRKDPSISSINELPKKVLKNVITPLSL